MSPNFRQQKIGGTTVIYPVSNVSKKGPIIVFAHDLWGGTKQMTRQMEECSRWGVGSCSIVFPVNSRTRFDDHVQGMKKAVWALSDSMSVVLVGFGMGGLISQVVASDNPDVVRAAVFVSSFMPKGVPLARPFWSNRFWLSMEHIASAYTGKLFKPSRRYAMKHLLNHMSEHQAEIVYAEMRPDSPTILREMVRGIPVGKISCPKLVIAGDHDRFIPEQSQMRLKEYLGSDFSAFPVGHMVSEEDLDLRVIRHILSWLDFKAKVLERRLAMS